MRGRVMECGAVRCDRAGRTPRAGACAAALIALCAATPALAQTAVQRNLPPAPKSQPAQVAPAPLPPAESDARPIAGPLKALVLLGPQSPVRTGEAAGVDTREVARLDNGRARRRLARFLGRPLSRRLISEIQAAITRWYRDQGYPFVSVSTPEQEISGG